MDGLTRSGLLQRLQCRRVGHDWGAWKIGHRIDHRQCDRCATRELRHFDAGATWLDKRWFLRRTFFGRLVEWHA